MRLPLFPFVVFDTETTGLIPRTDRVVELALQRFEEGEKVAEYQSLFAVPEKMGPVPRVLTRLSDENLRDAPTLEQEKEKILPLFQGAVIVAQNIGFDIGMLKGEGIDLTEWPQMDSAMLASLVFPEAQSYSLGYLSAFLDLPHQPKHRALGDVAATSALVGKVWERLIEFPQTSVAQIQELAEHGPEGYAMFFAGLTGTKGAKTPGWLQKFFEGQKAVGARCNEPLQDESAGERSWHAVKNLDATLRRVGAKGKTPVFAPPFLLDPQASENLLGQKQFTADELTLAIKLQLYHPAHHLDLPLHGGERDVWKGTLACTRKHPVYAAQLQKNGSLLLDHWQLLSLLLHEHKNAPKKGETIIIENASMLEDTATKALTWYAATDTLRAAAEGHEDLTGFLDAFQLWIERIRSGQDLRYLVEQDFTPREAAQVRERLTKLSLQDFPEATQETLTDLAKLLDPKNLLGRIAYIEQYRDGGQVVRSAPIDLASALRDLLYEKYATTLLLPPGDILEYAAILPAGSPVTVQVEALPHTLPFRLSDEAFTIDRLLPRVDGRVICLVSSKREIEKYAVQWTESLEEAGITLIAQGLSGGLGRMQSEFQTAGERAVWMMTPWMYEGVELPPKSVDHLWIASLPFDHPKNVILGRRADRFGQHAFDHYFIPRMLQRCFRLLLLYCDHRMDDGDVLLLDQRVRSKSYGKRAMEYLETVCKADG